MGVAFVTSLPCSVAYWPCLKISSNCRAYDVIIISLDIPRIVLY